MSRNTSRLSGTHASLALLGQAPAHDHQLSYPYSHLSDTELASFSADDFREVRVAATAYGIILFGRIRLPPIAEDGPCYVHFRAFTTGPDEQAKFHSIHTEEKE